MTKLFSRAYIEITNTCNLACSFCKKSGRAPCTMSAEKFDVALAQVAKHAKQVYLHVLGEPLLHPQLAEILQACKRRNMPVNITTNGTLLHKCGQLLINSGAVRKVSISLQCNENGVQQQYAQNVANFAKAAAQAGIYVELRYWRGGQTQAQALFNTFAALFGTPPQNKHFGPNIFFGEERPFVWPTLTQNGGAQQNANTASAAHITAQHFGEVDICVQQSASIIASLAHPAPQCFGEINACSASGCGQSAPASLSKTTAQHFNGPATCAAKGGEQHVATAEKIKTGGVFCHGLRNQFAILSDGTVVPCCIDADGDMALGNVFDGGLDAALQSPLAQNIYNGFSGGRAYHALCKNCSFLRRLKRFGSLAQK